MVSLLLLLLLLTSDTIADDELGMAGMTCSGYVRLAVMCELMREKREAEFEARAEKLS